MTGGPVVSPSEAPTIRTMIVDDHAMVAESLRRALQRETGIEIVAIAGTENDAVTAARLAQPDVIVMDLLLPDGDGIGAARRILAEQPSIRIVLLSGLGGRNRVPEAIGAGCVGYLEKSASVPELVEAIRRAHAGELVLIAEDLQLLLRPPSGDSGEPLTQRETEVLHLLGEGLGNRAIAQRLTISVDTVRTHVQRILNKLGAHSRLEAVAEARRRRLLP